MRVAFYNQMFALDGTSAVSNISGHWAVHFQSDAKRIWKRADVARTLAVIGESGADIVGIAEILEGQEESLARGLAKLGYAYVFFGRGHRTRKGKLLIQVALASKIPCEQASVPGFPLFEAMGGGGGIVECVFPSLGLIVINVHLALPNLRRDVHEAQLAFLDPYIAAKEGNMILMGDFNLQYREMQGRFPGLDLVSDERVTCSTTPLLRLVCAKDLDHILARGFSCGHVGELSGSSDHKLLYVDVFDKDG